VVPRIEQKEQVQGGIIIPDSAKEKPQEGEVVAVGKGKRLEDGSVVPLDVKAGDRILFGKYSGSDIKMDGQEYLIMREDEVSRKIDDRVDNCELPRNGCPPVSISYSTEPKLKRSLRASTPHPLQPPAE
jgi:chaperonin GroES